MSLFSQRIPLTVLALAISVVAVYSPTLVQRRVNVQGFKLPISRTPRLGHGRFPGQTLSTDASVTNSQEFAYMIQLNIGEQDFFVDLDTGSSDLWIVSTDCLSSDCNGIKKYSKTSSTSLFLSETPFRLSYLLGSVTGSVAFETVTVGPYEISSQVFALADKTIGLDLSSTGNSGILGLCFPSAAAISLTSGNTLLENLFAHFDESNRFFAFKLGRDSGPNDLSSSFTVGQLDPAIANDTTRFRFTSVSQAGADNFNYWKLPLRSLTINSTAFPLSQSLVPGAQDPIAVLDTGTTLILGPTPDVEAFWEAVGHGGAARKNVRTGMWEVRCERAVAVGFVLGEQGSEREYLVDPSDISWAVGGSVDGWCMGGIQANDGVNSGDWLLGDVFLRNVYVIHHGANSTHSPLIGLLSLTDPVSAMAQFRLARGPDSTPPSVQIRRSVSGASSPNTATVYTLSSICGFMGGAVLTIIFRVRRGSTKVAGRERNCLL